jgi:predicted secreted protein
MQLDGGITITKDLVLGGTLSGLAGAPVTMNAARVLADTTVEGTLITQRIEALNQGQLMQLDGGITITKDLVLGGTLSGLAGAPVTMNAVRVLADTTVEGRLITQRIEALNQGQLMQLDGGITITKDLVLGGTLSGLAGAPVTINAADIATDLDVGRDVSVLNDLAVANNADILNDLSVLNDAEVLGDLTVWGRKFFAQQHPTDSTKVITYAALEGPEAGTYVRGTARLVNGEATIELPESFQLVTAEAGLTAQVTLLEDCNGLYVPEKSTARIIVRELMNGTSNARFDYLVQGVRRDHESLDPIRAADGDEGQEEALRDVVSSPCIGRQGGDGE